MAKKDAAATADRKKTTCPVTKEQFMEHARAAIPSIRTKMAEELMVEPKAFATGSFGFYAGGKTIVMIDGTPVKFQIGLNITAVGSKPE